MENVNTPEPNLPIACPKCQNMVISSDFFCRYCGKSLRKKPVSLTVWGQLGLYIFCVLFPPFGLIPAYKYLRDTREKARIVGVVGVFLTLLTLIITIFASGQIISSFMGEFNSQINSLKLSP